MSANGTVWCGLAWDWLAASGAAGVATALSGPGAVPPCTAANGAGGFGGVTAIAAIGAKHEGVFRNHMIMPDGSVRHSFWYSIVQEDWPVVKANLEARLARFRHPGSAAARPLTR